MLLRIIFRDTWRPSVPKNYALGILAGGQYHEDHHDGRSIIDAVGSDKMTFSNSNRNRFRPTVESLINAAIKSIYSGEHST